MKYINPLTWVAFLLTVSIALIGVLGWAIRHFWMGHPDMDMHEKVARKPRKKKAQAAPVTQGKLFPDADSQPSNAGDKAAGPTLAPVAIDPPSTKSKKTAQKKNVITSYRGTLMDSGWKMRELSHGRFRSFCVILQKDGEEIPVWGNDLQRAVADSGVQPGELIEVKLNGTQDVPGRPDEDGNVQMVKKKIWLISRAH